LPPGLPHSPQFSWLSSPGSPARTPSGSLGNLPWPLGQFPARLGLCLPPVSASGTVPQFLSLCP
jgi:hypothetical protein